METTTVGAPAIPFWEQIKAAVLDVPGASADTWIAAANNFVLAHEQIRLLRESTPEEARDIDFAHGVLLDLARPLQKSLLDLGDRKRGSIVASLAWHLNEAWQMAHNPMSLEEAQRIADEVFPDERRA